MTGYGWLFVTAAAMWALVGINAAVMDKPVQGIIASFGFGLAVERCRRLGR